MLRKRAVVSGGGIVGCAAVLALARQGYDVELIEPSPPQAFKGRFGVDPRTVALSPSTVAWLRELLLTFDIPCQPIVSMRVWEETGTGFIDFNAHDVGANELAYVFEHATLAKALWSQASQKAVQLMVHPIENIDEGGASIEFANGRTAVPSIVVVAEGSASSTRDLTGVGRFSLGPRGIAIATVVQGDHSHKGVAFQKFADGILALLPMHRDRVMSVIWSMPAALATDLLELKEREFLQRLNVLSEGACGKLVEVDQRKSFPVFQEVARNFVPEPRIVLVGDAARTVHPLAGFGVNLGIEDVRALERAIAESGSQRGLQNALAQFAVRRQIRSQMMVALMFSFASVWSWSGGYPIWIRNLGVRCFNQSGLLKHQVIREAMGNSALTQFI